MKLRIYYGILIILLITLLGVTIISLKDNSLGMLFTNIYWLAVAGITVWFIWCKADLTDATPWINRKSNLTKAKLEKASALAQELTAYPDASIEEKEGYATLAGLCVNNRSENDLRDYLKDLKDSSNDPVMMTTLNEVIEISYDQGFDCLFQVDWKAESEDVEYFISKALERHRGITFKGPDLSALGEDAIVANDGVFEEFDAALRKHDLQLGFIDTQSDEYVFFVHKIEDVGIARDAVQKIGYQYFEKSF